ncbi:MAG: Ig-like domain-containing protein, partial [Actinomycetota bacterium]
ANKNIVIDNTLPMPMGFQPFPGAVGVQATSALTVIFPENMAAVANKKLFIKTAVPHTAATITTAALASNVATITTAAAHGLVAGNTVVIAMTPPNAVYDGTFQVTSAPTDTTFTVAKSNADVGSATVGGTATRTIWETITLATAGLGANVSISQFPSNSGAAVTITRVGKASTVNLITDPVTNYYVEAEAGAFTDLAGNPTAVLSGSSTWFFEASPDVVAPVFQPNQSDPPHNMSTFDPGRAIQLAFSEAVSTVGGKTIRLCTGDAGCATPVETFTLPSASVTSIGGGMRIQIAPTGGLLPSTTYFLLIDAGAFQDGAANPTAAATTAGQYQFTTMMPGGGGGELVVHQQIAAHRPSRRAVWEPG